MTPQERDVIAGIFDRLKQAANQPRDPEAERFIADRLREQPYAPYAMAQAVYVQEQAVTNLHAQVEDLQAQLRELQERAAQPAPQPQQSGGFLSGIFGGGQQAPARPGSVPSFPQRAGQAPSSAWTNQQPMQPGPQPGMMGAAPQPGPWANQAAPSAGGGFMASALTTAAGVAGGMMLGNVLSNAFGGGAAKAATPVAESTQAKDDTAKDDTANNDSANGDTDSQQAAYDQGASDQRAYDQGQSDQSSYDQANNDEPYDPDYDDGMGDDGDWT